MLLVPVDFSEGVDKLLAAAGELAGELGAGLLLFHVVEPVASYVPVGASMDVIAPPPSDWRAEDISAQEKKLEALAGTLRDNGLTVQTLVVSGLAVEEILEQARLRKASMIILASHGHGALYHLFTGSVVTGVLKRASCPVVVIPARNMARR